MFTCKQVSRSLSKDDYENLSTFKKLMLKLHVRLCIVCGKFNRQVMDSQDMCRHYKEREQKMESAPARPKMDDAKKSQLKKLLETENHAKP